MTIQTYLTKAVLIQSERYTRGTQAVRTRIQKVNNAQIVHKIDSNFCFWQ